MPIQLISYLQDTGFDLYNMREWLSGGAPPCQGGGRGFDPRLALEKRTIPNWYRSQTVDKTLLVSTPEAFFLFSVQKVCT